MYQRHALHRAAHLRQLVVRDQLVCVPANSNTKTQATHQGNARYLSKSEDLDSAGGYPADRMPIGIWLKSVSKYHECKAINLQSISSIRKFLNYIFLIFHLPCLYEF